MSDLEERATVALESIADSMRSIEDTILSIDTVDWSKKIEWYLHEFYTLAKTKVVGNADRPDIDSERP